MRVLKLFRCVGLGVAAAGFLYSTACSRSSQTSGYHTVPLVQGAKSLGLPLAGIAIDPARHDIYAIVGGEGGRDGSGRFVVLWKSADGASYCALLSMESGKVDSVGEVLADGQIRPLYDLSQLKPEGTAATPGVRMASHENRISPILDALSSDSEFYTR